MTLGGRECPVCHFPPTVEATVAHYKGQLSGTLGRFQVAYCPECKEIFEDAQSLCFPCGVNLERSLLFSLRYRFQQSPGLRFCVRWTYYLASAILLWRLLAYVETHQARNWIAWLTYGGVSIAYLAVAGLVVRWVARKSAVQAIQNFAPAGVRLALVLNFFSVVILLHIFVATWWTRATIFAGLFVVVLVAGWVLNRLLFPTYRRAMEIMFGEEATHLDTTAGQGRIIRYK